MHTYIWVRVQSSADHLPPDGMVAAPAPARAAQRLQNACTTAVGHLCSSCADVGQLCGSCTAAEAPPRLPHESYIGCTTAAQQLRSSCTTAVAALPFSCRTAAAGSCTMFVVELPFSCHSAVVQLLFNCRSHHARPPPHRGGGGSRCGGCTTAAQQL